LAALEIEKISKKTIITSAMKATSFSRKSICAKEDIVAKTDANTALTASIEKRGDLKESEHGNHY
jgi:hypothetical protein